MKLLGILILIVVGIAIACMQLSSIKTIIDDAKEEERAIAKEYAMRLADRRYQNMVKNTQYKIHQRVTFTNESDIKW